MAAILVRGWVPNLKRPAWIALVGLAAAFGITEAGVAVELRQWLDPAGSLFPWVQIPPAVLRVEQVREAATLLVLAAAATLAARGATARFATFLVLFGAWDLVYYATLRLWIAWPARVSDWDLLFLLPCPWLGPVYAPVLVASTMVVCGGIVLRRITTQGGTFRAGVPHLAGAAIAAGLVIASFLRPETPSASPHRYPIERLAAGEVVGILAFADVWRRNRPRSAR